MDIYHLFNEFITIGFKVRSSKLDGLQEWRDKSGSLNDTEKIGEWKTTRKNIESGDEIHTLEDNYNYVHDVLNMKGDDDDDKTNKELWDQCHFFLQLIRIPKKSSCTNKKIAQIGYNVGQFMAVFISGNYSKDAINYFNINKLGRLESYVDFIDSTSDSSDISDISGGNIKSFSGGSNLNVYNQFLSMTPLKNQIFSSSSNCHDCKKYGKCNSCGSEYINLK
jgi:hypothetical protein